MIDSIADWYRLLVFVHVEQTWKLLHLRLWSLFFNYLTVSFSTQMKLQSLQSVTSEMNWFIPTSQIQVTGSRVASHVLSHQSNDRNLIQVQVMWLESRPLLN